MAFSREIRPLSSPVTVTSRSAGVHMGVVAVGSVGVGSGSVGAPLTDGRGRVLGAVIGALTLTVAANAINNDNNEFALPTIDGKFQNHKYKNNIFCACAIV